MAAFETKNHIAIITGSAQGMGKEFARQLLEAGARVCISDISPEVGQKTAQEFQEIFGQEKVTFKECNVIKEEDWNILWNHVEDYFGDQVTLLVSVTTVFQYPSFTFGCLSFGYPSFRLPEFRLPDPSLL